MRYIGGKSKLLQDIDSFVMQKINNEIENKIFLDLFAGTGVVASHFKKYFQVMTNDSLYFSYILAKGYVTPNEIPKFEGLNTIGIKDPLDYLNNLEGKSGFITENYSTEKSDRMYFTTENAKKIDDIRITLNDWLNKNYITLDEFEYLLATLIEAVPFVSNIAGVYGAYLKHWDKRAFKTITLQHPILFNNSKENIAFNDIAENLTKSVIADIAYIDPPYNGRQYTSNYHLLETIARYDNPTIKGVTGIRANESDENSNFCKKSKVYNAFKEVLNQVKCQHLFISYSADGLLSKSQLEEILFSIGIPSTYDFKEIEYRLYKSKIVLKPKVNEYLFYIEKKINE